MSITRYDSVCNTVPFRSLTESEVIELVNRALSGNSHHATTYKYAFFKSIIDNVFNIDLDSQYLSYDNLATRFTEIYWNLVLNYHLRQEIKTEHHQYTGVEKELFEFCNKYKFDYSEKQTIFRFEVLRADLQLEIVKKIKKQMLRYVVSAFCGDTDDQFYHFNKKDKSDGIFMNPDVYNAIVKYKSVFEKQNYYQWIKYLEKANAEEDSYRLANKLDASTQRNNLSQYHKILVEFNQTRCFYCGKLLHQASDKDSPVDHFIPWSFVKDDKLWNFVLACPHCNTSKSNKIPDQFYFENLKNRNSRLCNMDLEIVHLDFKTYSYSRLIEMQHSAIFNGFEAGWKI